MPGENKIAGNFSMRNKNKVAGFPDPKIAGLHGKKNSLIFLLKLLQWGLVLFPRGKKESFEISPQPGGERKVFRFFPPPPYFHLIFLPHFLI